MNFFEEQIVINEKRIKKIRENPDPKKIAANAILYELERDLRIEQLQAWKDSKPFGEGSQMHQILKALGFTYLDLNAASLRLPMAQKYIDAIAAAGLPEYACDTTIVAVGMTLTGDFPFPSFIAATNVTCDPAYAQFLVIGRKFKVPAICIDIGLEAKNDTLSYVAAQLGEMIEFAERTVPGIKFNEEKFLELLEVDRIAGKYFHEIYELRKRTPLPMASRDVARVARLPSIYPNPARALEYLRSYRDEVGERAEKGIGGVAEEKARLLWAVTFPFHADPFKCLEKRGVTVPFFQTGTTANTLKTVYGLHRNEKLYGKKELSPLEEQAAMINNLSWNGLGSRWISHTLFHCRELKIDGIVYFMQTGCSATLGLGKLVSDAAEKDLGIPTLPLDGRMLDQTTYQGEAFEARLNEFVDIVFSRKGIN